MTPERPLLNDKSHSERPPEWLKYWASGQIKNHLSTKSLLSLDGS